jgi:exodeoxyribonuclease-3
VRLVSWNVSGRVKRLGEQAERLLGAAPDVICLQEVTRTTEPLWRTALAGWSVEVADLAAARSRPLGVLTAARSELSVVPVAGVPWPERVLSVVVDGVEVVNVHSPISPKPELAKVRTHEAVFAHLAQPADRPRLVCGDLNTPRREHPDGSAWTFARTRSGHLRPDRGERWDRAELALIRGLEAHGFRDAWRELHGHDRREPSWEWPRWGGGYRLDHLICSAEIAVSECAYVHDWRREDKLSDHSALTAELSLRNAAHRRG